jgi:hypothetical protein
MSQTHPNGKKDAAGWRSPGVLVGLISALIAAAAVIVAAIIQSHPSPGAAGNLPATQRSRSATPHATAPPTVTTPCRSTYPAVLDIPHETGSVVHASVLATCNFSDSRMYLVIEKVFNVSSNTNPHSVDFVKASVSQLTAGQKDHVSFILKEPVGTKATFFVISVNHSELEALRKHQVADHGILHLPPGARMESTTEKHVKTSQ